MINLTTKAESALRPDLLSEKPQAAQAMTPRTLETDRLNATSQETLQAVLREQPEVRPETLERAQKLVVDANYPPKDIIRRLSELLIRTADLAE